MKSFSFILFLVLLSVFIPSYAQKRASVEGTIIDSNTGESLPGANVYLEGTSIGGITTSDGSYSITGISEGSYVLIVSYIGYDNIRESLEIRSGEVLQKDIELSYSGGFDLEGIVITAQAKGQVKAINQQLNAQSMMNVVAAERIQELPDANAAEALGRLPGVALKRSGGEGSSVVIRGLSPKYTKIMIDGVEMPSTSSGDRSSSLGMISPFSLGGIEVIKSPTAEQDADFIGGMVNFKLRTAEEGFHTDLLAEGSYNTLKDTYNDYNFVGNIGKRFFDNKFGVFLQANLERRNRSANTQNWGYGRKAPYDWELSPNNLYEPYSNYLSDVLRERKRAGATLVLDYVLKGGKITFSNMINQGQTNKETQTERYYIPAYQGNHDMFLSTGILHDQTTVMTNVLRYEQSVSRFNLEGHLSHSYSGSDGVSRSIGSRNPLNPEDLDDTGVPNYYNYVPSSTRANGLSDNNSEQYQRQFEAAANVEMAFSISSQINGKLKMGGKLRTRYKEYDAESWNASWNEHENIRTDLRTEFTELGGEPDEQFKYEHLMDNNYIPHEFLKGDFTLGPRLMVDLIDPMADYLKNVYHANYPDAMNYTQQKPNSRMNDYHGNESWAAAFLLADISITSKLSIIPGIRYEQNQTTYTSLFLNADWIVGSPVQIYDTVTTSRQNGYWLPNLQMKYEPMDWLQLRFGYSNTLARPNYTSLTPRTVVTSTNTITQNEFNLRPEQSRNFDFMVSIKQNHLGLFTMGAFVKNIEDKILSAPARYMFDASEYHLDSAKYSGYLISTQFNNENTTYVKGLEFDLQTVFWFLPGPLKGLVLNTNYTFTHSESKYKTTEIDKRMDPNTFLTTITNIDSFFVDRLVDQPGHVVNVSLGYDYKGFSVRVSMNYQSDMFRGISLFPEERRYSQGLMRWDLAIKQSLPVPGLQVYANVNNITGVIETDVMGTASRLPVHNEFYGTTFTLGLRWRLQ